MLFTMRLGSGLGLEARPLGRKWTTNLDGWCEELGLAGVLCGGDGVGWGGVGLGELSLGVIGDGVDVWVMRCGACDEPLREGSEGSGPLYDDPSASFCETDSRSLRMSTIPEESGLSWLEVT